MKVPHLAWIMLCMLVNCSPKKSGSINANSIKEFSDSVFVYRVGVDSLDSALSYSGGKIYTIKLISISRKSDGKLVQEIMAPKNWYDGTMDFFKVQDANFDGLNDFCILVDSPGPRYYLYSFWIFDKSKNLFQQDTSMANFLNPEFDYNNKIVTATEYPEMGKINTSYFQFINGKLTITRDEHTDLTNQPDAPDSTATRN